MRVPIQITVFTLASLISLGALAAEYQVKGDGTGDFQTIQEAIYAAADGDVVIVHPGMYYENIRFEGKNITLRSTDPEDRSVVELTIIDGQQLDSVVTFSGAENETCQLNGLSITNGLATYGGGIIAGTGDFPLSRVSIVNCVIHGNTAKWGGAIYGHDGRIEDCTIRDNHASNNGGALHGCRGEVVRCIIWGNTSDRYGGATGQCDCLLANCLICDNSAGQGGAVEGDYERSPTIRSCTIAGNIASRGGGLLDFEGAVFNSIIWGNWSPDGLDFYPEDASFTAYSSCIGGWESDDFGNISDDPLFVDAVECDYHLSAASPCIDAGDNAYTVPLLDVEGVPRIVNRTIDIGAYELPLGCYVYIEPDQKVYSTGETAKLLLRAGSLDGDRLVDIYAAIRVPGGQVDFVPSLSPEMVPWFDGISLGPEGELADTFEYGLTDSSPEGGYAVYCAVYEHGSGNWEDLLTNVSEAYFVHQKGQPTTFEVKTDGSGNFLTIQQAIDAAIEGDTIVLHPGTYFENVRFRGPNITLRSTDPGDQNIVSATIIDGQQHGSTVTLDGTEDGTCKLIGLTITNGDGEYGGGICGHGKWSTQRAKTSILNCVIKSNRAQDSGGGIAYCGGTIANCEISDNYADEHGGGLYGCGGRIEHCVIWSNGAHDGGGLSSCSGEIVFCEIINNASFFDGGGLYYCNGRIEDCTVDRNWSGAGGGGAFAECHGLIERCTISYNYLATSHYGSAFYYCEATIVSCLIRRNKENAIYYSNGQFTNCTIGYNSGIAFADCTGTIQNCIIWGNQEQLKWSSTPSYSCIEGWTGGGEGNISEDPMFEGVRKESYRLESGSPCINAGCNSSVIGEADAAGQPRIVGPVVDMGAYEYLAGCFVSIAPDQELYTGSDEMTLRLGVGEFGPSQLVDIYAAIAFRGRELVFLPNLTPSWAPWFSGVELREGPVILEDFVYPFTGAERDGTSFALAAVFPQGSRDFGDLLTNVASCSFQYHRAGAAEFHVVQDGTGDFGTIQDAIDASLDGDTLVIHPGTFTENIDNLRKSITITSVDPSDPQIIASTVIQGQSEEAVVTLRRANGLCEVSGLAITGGGAGIVGYGSPDPDVRITSCIVSNNGEANQYCLGSGCGIYGCDGDIENCLVRWNLSSGIAYSGCSILNSFIVGNGYSGVYRCTGEVHNCLVTGNTMTGNGGGMSYCTGPFKNCTIADNIADSSGEIYGCEGRIQNCIVWGRFANSATNVSGLSLVTYCCIRDYTGEGEGNISDNPQFVSGPLGEYYLAPYSPCIDAGSQSAEKAGLSDRTTQADGSPDVGVVDIGFHYAILEGEANLCRLAFVPGDTTRGQ